MISESLKTNTTLTTFFLGCTEERNNNNNRGRKTERRREIKTMKNDNVILNREQNWRRRSENDK